VALHHVGADEVISDDADRIGDGGDPRRRPRRGDRVERGRLPRVRHGRSIDDADLPHTVACIRCDHLRDEQTAAALQRVAQAGGLDVLVNNAWGGYERMIEDGGFTWTLPFWEQPSHRWSGMIDGGVRAAFVAAAGAARIMLPRGRGLSVNMSFWTAQKYLGNTI
jgi:dehydrogenase/reductase SDR family protein 1